MKSNKILLIIFGVALLSLFVYNLVLRVSGEDINNCAGFLLVGEGGIEQSICVDSGYNVLYDYSQKM